jgi:hypothetical protein
MNLASHISSFEKLKRKRRIPGKSSSSSLFDRERGRLVCRLIANRFWSMSRGRVKIAATASVMIICFDYASTPCFNCETNA